MNINKLYRYSNTPVSMKKFCKLCEVDLDRLTHIEDCPGLVLESLRYEIQVEGPHCGRGCCGHTNARVEGDSFEAIAEEAVREGSDAISVHYTGSVRAPMELPAGLMQATVARLNQQKEDAEAAERAKQEAQERERAYVFALARLEQERPDLSEEGYVRRKDRIEKEYKA